MTDFYEKQDIYEKCIYRKQRKELNNSLNIKNYI